MKTVRTIAFADTTPFRARESAHASTASDAPLAGANGAKLLPFAAALAGLLTLSLASAATIPQSQDRAGDAPQPPTLSRIPLSPSDVTVSDGEAHATGLSGLDSLKPAPLMQTNSVVCATCCLDLTACGAEASLSSGHTVHTRNLSLERWSGDSVALFNFGSSSSLDGKRGRRFQFGLGRTHSLDGSVKSGQTATPRPTQEWDVAPLTLSTAPGLASKAGLRLFTWSF